MYGKTTIYLPTHVNNILEHENNSIFKNILRGKRECGIKRQIHYFRERTLYELTFVMNFCHVNIFESCLLYLLKKLISNVLNLGKNWAFTISPSLVFYNITLTSLLLFFKLWSEGFMPYCSTK
jgi:hypothetical protein